MQFNFTSTMRDIYSDKTSDDKTTDKDFCNKHRKFETQSYKIICWSGRSNYTRNKKYISPMLISFYSRYSRNLCSCNTSNLIQFLLNVYLKSQCNINNGEFWSKKTEFVTASLFRTFQFTELNILFQNWEFPLSCMISTPSLFCT